VTTYESVRQMIESVPNATSTTVRDVKWLTDAHIVGVSRDTNGHVELFMAGLEIFPLSASVRDAMEFRVVHRNGQPSFDANLLALPAPAYFDQVAAFIGTELLRSGADSSLVNAFEKTEPIIELAIERLRLSNQVIVGLVGELLLLDSLCRRATDAHVAKIVGSWDGWKRSSRDFSLETTGVEVKTTTGKSSSHIVEGVHQVERGTVSGNGQTEDRLFLVSVGVETGTREENAVTIPELVDRIIERMRVAGSNEVDVGQFLSRLAEYGSDSGSGYDHPTQASEPAYSAGFLTTYFRAYDMDDPAVEVLRRQDVTLRAHVDVSSVKFRIDLPMAVSANNPIVGANQVADAILRARPRK
jgi:hypothetical protein